MFGIDDLFLLGAGALGGLFGNKSKQTQSSTTTPSLSPAFQPLQQLLLQQAMQRLQGGGPGLGGYESSGISNINKGFGLADMALQARLRSRGLSRSPIAGAADARLEGDRAGQITQFQNQLPLLQRDLQNQDLQFGAGLLPMGHGSTTTGTSQGTSGGGLGGAFEDFGTMLGYLMGQGAFKKR